jgi:hypothetical protein
LENFTMNQCFATTLFRAAALPPILIAAVLFATACSGRLSAQTLVSAGNQFVKVSVVSDTASNTGGGRFVIDAGPALNDYRLLYYITSNVVFKITSGGVDSYFTNARSMFGGAPSIDSVTFVPYRAFDSIYSSADTIAVTWKRLAGSVDVTMRMIPEVPGSPYVQGSDVLIEFSYSPTPGAAPAELGVLMMLDTYNGQAAGATGGSGDKSSVMTSRGYFPTAQPGRLFARQADEIPEFYHVGNFLYTAPLNDLLPIHRLKGTSHNGAPLTEPELLAIGDWHVLRNVGWDVQSPMVTSRNVGDCATIVRWSGLRNAGTIRTAFGVDDRLGNDMYHCRDSRIFVDIATERVVVPSDDGVTYAERKFDVTMWATNTGDSAANITISLADLVGDPTAGRFALDSAPAAQSGAFQPHETRMFRWRLKTLPGFTDVRDVPLDFKYQYEGTSASTFKMACMPIITVRNPLSAGVRADPEAGEGLAILDISPQPLATSAGRVLEVRIGGMRPGRSAIDLIALDGRLVARYNFDEGSGGLAVRALGVPAGTPAGVYMLRVSGAAGHASAKVVVIE